MTASEVCRQPLIQIAHPGRAGGSLTPSLISVPPPSLPPDQLGHLAGTLHLLPQLPLESHARAQQRPGSRLLPPLSGPRHFFWSCSRRAAARTAAGEMGKESCQAACLLLLQMLFSPLFLAAERQQTGVSGGVQCLNSYGIQHRRVDCTWHWNQTMGEGPFYLNFSDPYRNTGDHLICRLSPSDKAQDEYSCSAEGSGQFEENDEYIVSLHDESVGGKVVSTAWDATYDPMQNIKCDPPYDFWSNMSGSKCLVGWKMPKAYVLIWEAMQWQLQLRATHVPWEKAETKTVVTTETWMEIDGSEFTPGTSYVARVRCKTPDDGAYISHWSEWSNTTEWRVPPGASQQKESLVLLAVLVSVPLCLGALLLLLLLSSFHSRIKSGCLAHTPSPAAFFLPLYTSHNGNFQAWLGIQERDVWLRSSNSTSPGKNAGLGTVSPRPLEAISQLSSFGHLSGVELPSEERVCPLPSAPDQQGKGSNYVVLQQEEAEAPMLPIRASLHLEGLNAAGEGFPYLPYKNFLLVEQQPQETEISSSSCGKASWSLGSSAHSMAPV